MGTYAFIGGGCDNTTSGAYATIGGGHTNQAYGDYGTVPGGANNEAGGDYSFAAGRYAKANHNNSFVWNDGYNLSSLETTASYQTLIGATNGVAINGNAPMASLDLSQDASLACLHFSNGTRDITWMPHPRPPDRPVGRYRLDRTHANRLQRLRGYRRYQSQLPA